MTLTIYHNPRCSKSRQALTLLRDAGVEPLIVEYLKTPLNEAELTALLAKLKLNARNILRKGETPYKALALKDTGKSQQDLIRAIAAHPILMERPIVVKGPRAVLGRPPEDVLSLV